MKAPDPDIALEKEKKRKEALEKKLAEEKVRFLSTRRCRHFLGLADTPLLRRERCLGHIDTELRQLGDFPQADVHVLAKELEAQGYASVQAAA